MTADERIIAQLIVGGPSSCASLAAALSWRERVVRHRLRRLVKNGYVFSSARGQYLATLAGRLLLVWGEDPATGGPGALDLTAREVLGICRLHR